MKLFAKFLKSIALCATVLALANCTGSGTSALQPKITGPTPQQLALTTKCALFENAFNQTKQETGRDAYGLLKDCPAAQNLPAGTSTDSGTLFLSRADSATLPLGASAKGKTATKVFRLMIERGAPAKIAVAQSQTPEFSRAVNAAKRVR